MKKPKKVVVFLQNAYSSVYAGKWWPRESWLTALRKSRSGQRLRNLTSRCEGIDWWFDNTTSAVGIDADSIEPADLVHMKLVVKHQKPKLVVCMGVQAKEAWSRLPGVKRIPVLFTPHPAYRVITNGLLQEARDLIMGGFTGTKELKQEKPVDSLSKT